MGALCPPPPFPRENPFPPPRKLSGTGQNRHDHFTVSHGTRVRSSFFLRTLKVADSSGRN